MNIKKIIKDKSRSVLIRGWAGQGKTTAVKQYIQELRKKEEIRIISINTARAFSDQFDGIITNTISTALVEDRIKPDISLLNTEWQDIEFDIPVGRVPVELFKSLKKEINKFVDDSDTPCLIIVEELSMFTEESVRCLMQISDAVEFKYGYSLYTFRPERKINAVLRRWNKVASLGGKISLEEKKEVDFSQVDFSEFIDSLKKKYEAKKNA